MSNQQALCPFHNARKSGSVPTRMYIYRLQWRRRRYFPDGTSPQVEWRPGATLSPLSLSPGRLPFVVVLGDRTGLLDTVSDELTVIVTVDGHRQRPGSAVGVVVGVDPGAVVADQYRPVGLGLGGVELRQNLGFHRVAAAA